MIPVVFGGRKSFVVTIGQREVVRGLLCMYIVHIEEMILYVSCGGERSYEIIRGPNDQNIVKHYILRRLNVMHVILSKFLAFVK